MHLKIPSSGASSKILILKIPSPDASQGVFSETGHVHQSVSDRSSQKDDFLNFKIPYQRSNNSSSSSKALMAVKMVKRARRLGGCNRCFSLDHNCFECRDGVRCAACFNYGHKFKFCLTESRPRIYWRPKKLLCEQPTARNKEVDVAETKESPPPFISMRSHRTNDKTPAP